MVNFSGSFCFCHLMTNGVQRRLGSSEPDRATWKRAFDLYLQAFKEPASDGERRKLNKLLKKPVRKDLADELFDYNGFLRGLGRMNLSA